MNSRHQSVYNFSHAPKIIYSQILIIYAQTIDSFISLVYITLRKQCKQKNFLYYLQRRLYMKYCERIRALREDHDKSQTQIARILHVGQRTYSDYETGRTRIPLESLIVLAKYYDLSLDYIAGISDVKTPYPKK